MAGMLTGQALTDALNTMRQTLLAMCEQTTPGIDGIPGVNNPNPTAVMYEVHPENGFSPAVIPAAAPAPASGPATAVGANPSLDPNFSLPINGTTAQRWTKFVVFLEAYGAVDDQWAGYPFDDSYPKFKGDAISLPTPGTGSYIAPIAGVACNRGEAKRVHLKALEVDYLNMDEHTATVNCQAFNQDEGPGTALLQSLVNDTTKAVTGAAAFSGAATFLPSTMSTLLDGIKSMIAKLGGATEVGSVQALVNIPLQAWIKPIPQNTWVCYKFMKFQKVYPQKVPVVGSDDQDLFLVLFRLVLTTNTTVSYIFDPRPPTVPRTPGPFTPPGGSGG